MSKPLIIECDCNGVYFTSGELIQIYDYECYDIDNGCIYTFTYDDGCFSVNIQLAIMQSGNVYDINYYETDIKCESKYEFVTEYELGNHLGTLPLYDNDIAFWYCIIDIIRKMV